MQMHCPYCETSSTLDLGDELDTVTCPTCGRELTTDEALDETELVDSSDEFIAHFKLVEMVGRGGFGKVWRATDTVLDRTVAVKVAHNVGNEQRDFDAFIREARTAARLKHPNVVTVHEVGRRGDRVFIVSDFVEGLTLKQWKEIRGVDPRKAAEICSKIALAVYHAHEAGIVHRDLKPSNVLMGKDDEPFVTDFGIAKRMEGDATFSVDGRIVGTPAYMSPEQARGDSKNVGPRSDIYSIGVILFELLTGDLPFRGDRQMLLYQILNDDPDSPRRFNGAVSKDLETICLKCLEKDPANRFESAEELALELDRYVQGEPIKSRGITTAERLWRRYTRDPNAPTLVAGGYAFLLGSILLGWGIIGIITTITGRSWIANYQQVLLEITALTLLTYLPTLFFGVQVLNGKRWILWPMVFAFSLGTIATLVSATTDAFWLGIMASVNVDSSHFPRAQLFSLLFVLLLFGTITQVLALVANRKRSS